MSICPIEKLIQFDLLDDCIHTPAGYYHFYRYYPPNTDIMTEEEKKAEIEQMTQLFDTLAREIAIFATDKIEDMSEIKRFYKNLAPEYDHLTSDIIAAIESTESRNSAAVQRAFYFIIRTDKQEESVYNQIAGKGYHINKAQREELAVLLRNYYLREFISAEIYTLEKELKQDVKLRKKIEKKPELFQKELQRRLLPHSMEFFPSFAVQNGTYRSTMMLKNFPFEIGSCCLLQTACMRGTSFMMRLTAWDKKAWIMQRYTPASKNWPGQAAFRSRKSSFPASACTGITAHPRMQSQSTAIWRIRKLLLPCATSTHTACCTEPALSPRPFVNLRHKVWHSC